MSGSRIDQFREKAGYVASRAELRDLRSRRLRAELLGSPASSALSYNLQSSVSVTFDEGEDRFVVEAEYVLRIRQAPSEAREATETDEEEIEDLAIVEIMIGALFIMSLGEEDRRPEPDEVEAFGRTTGLPALHPYARETVASLTGRLGLPTLTLPVLRIDMGEIIDD